MGPTPGLQELQADLARILSLLLSNEEVNRSTLATEVQKFIEVYDPLRKNEVWMQQFSHVVASTYLVSVLVDRFEFFDSKPFLQLLLFCASFCTYYAPCAQLWKRVYRTSSLEPRKVPREVF